MKPRTYDPGEAARRTDERNAREKRKRPKMRGRFIRRRGPDKAREAAA